MRSARSLPDYVQWVRTQGGGKGNVWEGNVWADTGKPVPPA